MTSYHDVHVTTASIVRTSIFNLPYGLELSCTRVTGWQLWDVSNGRERAVLLGGEYEGDAMPLRVDVDGVVVVDSFTLVPASREVDRG